MSGLKPPSAEDETAKARAGALWEQDRARLMLAQPFLALLAMQLELVPVVDARLSAAATDGERVYVNAHFLLRLQSEQRLFVLAHEVWHCAALHFLRRGQREPALWNLAADHEVNALLQEQRLRVPEGAVLYRNLLGENAESVYRWLQRNPKERRPRGELADQHEWRPAEDGDAVHDPDFAPAAEGAWRGWPARVVAAAQQVERQHGSLPASIERLVSQYRQPQLPWPQLLQEFVVQGYHSRRQWTPPNRRFVGQGLYLPGRERQPLLELALAVDTSGSTSPVLGDFIAELVGIVEAFGDYRLRLLMCDAVVQSDRIYTPEQPPRPGNIKLRGGGGTDFCPVFERLAAEPPRVLVWLTDGFGRAPAEAPPYPVLWALTEDGRRPTSWGDVLRLP